MAIQVTYRRTRRLSMRIVKNGDVHVSAPIGMPKKEVERFIEEHHDWITEARKKTYESQKRRADFYSQLPLKTREQADDALQRLKALIEPMLERHSKEMGVKPSVVYYKAMISRWGVCYVRITPSASRPICCCCRNGVSSMWWFMNYVICWNVVIIPVSMLSWINTSPVGRKPARLQFFNQFNYLLLGFFCLLLVNLGTDVAHIFYFPVVADVAELSDGTVIDTW